MKKIYSLVLLCFIQNTLLSQIIFDRKTAIEIPVIVINDSCFQQVLEQYITSKNKLEDDEMYSVIIDKYKDNYYNISVEQVALGTYFDFSGYGCFEINNDIYIVNGYNPNGIFTITNQRKTICAVTQYTNYKGEIKIRTFLNDYPIWYFIYENKRLLYQMKRR